MGQWNKTIQLKHALGEDTSAEGIILAADKIVEILEPHGFPVRNIKKAKEIAGTDADTALIIFNDAIDSIYDYAYLTRVWLA